MALLKKLVSRKAWVGLLRCPPPPCLGYALRHQVCAEPASSPSPNLFAPSPPLTSSPAPSGEPSPSYRSQHGIQCGRACACSSQSFGAVQLPSAPVRAVNTYSAGGLGAGPVISLSEDARPNWLPALVPFSIKMQFSWLIQRLGMTGPCAWVGGSV